MFCFTATAPTVIPAAIPLGCSPGVQLQVPNKKYVVSVSQGGVITFTPTSQFSNETRTPSPTTPFPQTEETVSTGMPSQEREETPCSNTPIPRREGTFSPSTPIPERERTLSRATPIQEREQTLSPATPIQETEGNISQLSNHQVILCSTPVSGDGRRHFRPSEILPIPQVAQTGPRVQQPNKRLGKARNLTSEPELKRIKEAYEEKLLKQKKKDEAALKRITVLKHLNLITDLQFV